VYSSRPPYRKDLPYTAIHAIFMASRATKRKEKEAG
ncbi:hypothetical protein ALC57_05194, partial [Trachymyrmex cornetzi]